MTLLMIAGIVAAVGLWFLVGLMLGSQGAWRAGYERGISDGAEATQWAYEHAGDLAEACEEVAGERNEWVVKQRKASPWQ